MGSPTAIPENCMSAHACNATTADFQEKVIEASRRAPVLVDFWAEWCQPCRVFKPILEKLAGEYGGRFLLVKINSDENQELAAKLGVRGIPAVKAFVDGQLANEFTGALPESQVREFIDSLVPSPAEPLRLEAIAAYQRGELDAAKQLFGQALRLDPKNENARLDIAEVCLEAGAVDEARNILDTLAGKAKDPARLEALLARLALAVGAGGGDPAALRARVDADPADLNGRLQLANALALGKDYRGALDELLEIVRRDRTWQDEAGRKTMLKLFSVLGANPEYDDLLRQYRTALARILN
jgi:putative thioredoxin